LESVVQPNPPWPRHAATELQLNKRAGDSKQERERKKKLAEKELLWVTGELEVVVAFARARKAYP